METPKKKKEWGEKERVRRRRKKKNSLKPLSTSPPNSLSAPRSLFYRLVLYPFCKISLSHPPKYSFSLLSSFLYLTGETGNRRKENLESFFLSRFFFFCFRPLSLFFSQSLSCSLPRSLSPASPIHLLPRLTAAGRPRRRSASSRRRTRQSPRQHRSPRRPSSARKSFS